MRSFTLWDGETWVIAKSRALQKPKPWLPMVFHGRWTGDEWGSFQLEVRDILPVVLD